MASRTWLGNLKLTTLMATLVISAVVVSVSAVSGFVYLNLQDETYARVNAKQHADLKAAATILKLDLLGTEIGWNEDGSIGTIKTWGLPPKFPNHDAVDSIVRLTGEAAAIYAWKPDLQQFAVVSSTFADASGNRVVDTVLDDPGALAAMKDRRAYLGEGSFEGQQYYTAYQPILDMKDNTIGVLFNAVDKIGVEQAIWNMVRLLVMVGVVSVALLGLIGYVLSRRLMLPVPKLARIMQSLSTGDFQVPVPYTGNRNELGDMARSIEVFRNNGIKVNELTEAEQANAAQALQQRSVMMASLQQAFGDVVEAAAAGDFTRRVEHRFADEELNGLALGLNRLVGTVGESLDELGSMLGALAEKDLSRRMEGSYSGSFARLRDDANGLAERLGEVIGELKQASGSLKAATGEILAGANDLSERTTRQAATIQETTAALDQLVTTVVQNSKTADAASGTAQEIAVTAEESARSMQQATAAMDRISTSSSKISGIIGMIDDIAFQTNLLALNASVEAARAGDAGRGFAVVAVEVRRLAQSAASASGDVKKLIEESAVQVSEGSRLVEGAARELSSMQTKIRESTSTMKAIARASVEQSIALKEVSTAVRTMDEMTQHNAALVEETNAALEQTESQASQLDRIAGIFRIGASDAPSVASDERHAKAGQRRSAA